MTVIAPYALNYYNYNTTIFTIALTNYNTAFITQLT